MSFVPIPISPNKKRAQTTLFFLRLMLFVMAFNTALTLLLALTSAGTQNAFVNYIVRYLPIAVYVDFCIKLVMVTLLAVFFIRWMRRAYHNLHKAGLTTLRYSEGWAAAGWFVPFINFFYPVQIVREIFRETQNVFRLRDQPYQRMSDAIVTLWWSFIVISIFFRIGGNDQFSGGHLHHRNDLLTGYLMYAAAGASGFVAALIAFRMVSRISEMEDDMMIRAQQYYTWMNSRLALQQTENPQAAPAESKISNKPFMPPQQ